MFLAFGGVIIAATGIQSLILFVLFARTQDRPIEGGIFPLHKFFRTKGALNFLPRFPEFKLSLHIAMRTSLNISENVTCSFLCQAVALCISLLSKA